MDASFVQQLELYFRLAPAPSGLILPPDPADHLFLPQGLINGRPIRQAAVLVPVIRASPGRESHIVLTLRTENLRSHAGQVSLPGGTADPEDADIVRTALREAEEETHLAPEAVQVIGTLPALLLPSAYHVTPVVGLIGSEVVLKPAPAEVAEIFLVPCSLLMNPDNYRIATMQFQNRERRFLELQFGPYRIWGATAAILHHLATQLKAFEIPSAKR
jgi:8-oxo-dGTP pyrophosphatase MutT (NUDIX family)